MLALFMACCITYRLLAYFSSSFIIADMKEGLNGKV